MRPKPASGPRRRSRRPLVIITLNLGLLGPQSPLPGYFFNYMDDPLVRGLPTFAGGLYAAPDPRGFDAMATRFQSRFGYRPPRLASLSYDGVSLIAALAAQNIGFSQTILTNPDGFDGTDGIFRFNARGTNERGLAIMAVATGAPQIVVPAPRSFSAGF